MDTTDTRVLKILAKQARKKPEQLTLETSLESLGIDSLGMVEIIFGLEEEFNISIPESNDIQQRLKGFASIGDVTELVRSCLETAGATR